MSQGGGGSGSGIGGCGGGSGVPRDELPLWLWLGAMSGIGPLRAKALLDAYGSPAAVMGQPHKCLSSLSFMTPRAASMVLDAAARKAAGPLAESILASGIDIVTMASDSYPPLLRFVCDAPLVLFSRGARAALCGGARAIAIVGSRHPTAYGISVTRSLAAGLCSYGFTIVSGLAMGIDAAAHAEALAVGGRTAAFLGCGADRAHPPCNRRLMGEIIEKGAVFSEFLPGTPPLPQHFPQRNRLISGSALGVVVVEAGERSGALITAGFAAEQGRDVFAVPGNVTSAMSRGANALLRDGAVFAASAEDIVFALGPLLDAGGGESGGAGGGDSGGAGGGAIGGRRKPPIPAAESLRGPEREVAGFLQSRGAASLDEIADSLSLDIAAICAAVVVLETVGMVRKLPYETYEFIR